MRSCGLLGVGGWIEEKKTIRKSYCEVLVGGKCGEMGG